MILDPETQTRLRAAILERGRGVSQKLSAIMAGKQVDLSSVRARLDEPGMRPDELLRAWLDQLMAIRDQIDANDGSYGRCRHCGEDIGLTELEQMPWADSCRGCAGA